MARRPLVRKMMTREREALAREALAGEELSLEALGSETQPGHEGCWARKRWSGREAPRKAQTFVHEQVLEYGRKP